ncbi:MAG: substrate-binding domain-containing protein [Nitrospinota bacterium]|nr:substrate-binding domain-containing protein [Nitrospinota bacterium]
MLQIFVLFFVLIFAPLHSTEAKRLKFATTTSVANSGILSPLLFEFKKKHKTPVHAIITGTGKALEMGKHGDVDLILTHAPELEHIFIKKKYGINKKKIMFNYFLIAGPLSYKPFLKNENVLGVLEKIAKRKLKWISRGDNSGTHIKEMELWKIARLNPRGKWYLSSGLGMGRSLIMAEEKNAFILTDRGTYLSFLHRNKISLRIIFGQKDPNLLNEYSLIQINPKKHKYILHEEAVKFSDFLVSNAAQCIIKNFKVKQVALFNPASTCISK